MSYALKPFSAPSLTVSYNSDVTKFETRGNRTGYNLSVSDLVNDTP